MDNTARLIAQRYLMNPATEPFLAGAPPLPPSQYGLPGRVPNAFTPAYGMGPMADPGFGAAPGVGGAPGGDPGQFALPPKPANDWQTTGVFPNGGYDANNINASDPAARQNALHILNDYAGENRESQGQQDAQSNMDQAQQNQDQTGVYGYGSI